MHPESTRKLSTIAITAAALAFTVGTALPALADPPAGHGHGNPPSSAPGQAKKATPTPTPTPTATHTPPGKGHGKGGVGKGHGAAGHGNGTGNAAKTGGAPGHNPPGNNGTVKVHTVAGDPGHHNSPQVGCSSFFVDFWGFDQGQTLNVSFVGQAPTGMGTPVSFTAPDGTSITSPDPAGGGNDFDGELPFIATASDLAVLGPPANHGYHIRLLVATHQGGGFKQKVFWIAPCAAMPTPVAPPGPATPDTPQLSSHHLTVLPPAAPAHPQLQSATDTVSQDSPPVSSLPFTGADLAGVISAGIAAVATGMLLTILGRRRRKIG